MNIEPLTGNSSGLNVTQLMDSLFNDIDTAGTTLSQNIQGIINSGSDLNQGELLKMQFQVGQYNAMLEMASTVSKSLTDMMKTLAQRTS